MSTAETTRHETIEHAPGTVHPHVVPPKVLLAVYAVLVVLTVATVAVTAVDLGKLDLLAAMGTVMVIGVSFTLARTLHYLRIERQPDFRMWLTISLVLACGFIVVQTPAMVELLHAHQRLRAQGLFL